MCKDTYGNLTRDKDKQGADLQRVTHVTANKYCNIFKCTVIFGVD